MERARIRALCAVEGVTVSELLHQIVVPEINSRLMRDLEGRADDGAARSRARQPGGADLGAWRTEP